MTVKLDTEGIRCIGVFESLTGAGVKDCILDNDRVIMVVKKGDMGLAIGKGGSNINKVKKLLKKNIEVVEHSSDIKEFIENLLRPAVVKNVELLTTKDNKCYAYVEVSNKDKGIAIGKNGEKIKRVKLLVKRNQNIDNVIIK
ncbi:MAG: NusA-like transcription termination signal-binding factor [Methanophagales archaeon]|nr:NusA-like transcription termination signal-binding factor [Methanophagales archaeon]MCW3138870.1 NusA-like transcription termination signal-binding factor [Methanophagales archaeon]MCW3139347.1 NusA-like transcription termination signal-binding factor [Methanophagales archaeon]MCW7069111.1 NusA-like transcription termination signal-binding factor [Methanophagales archaeon]MCW7073414.1 NusA-like transcription termination signal-binding factor [Methanophagales archaeon]